MMGTKYTAIELRRKVKATIKKATEEGLEVSRKKLIGVLIVEGKTQRYAREVVDGFIDSGYWETREEDGDILIKEAPTLTYEEGNDRIDEILNGKNEI